MSRATVFVAALVVCGCCRVVVAEGAIKRLMADEDSRAKILEHLEQLTDLEFADTPLSDVVDYIKSKHEFEIQLDTKGLTDAAVDASAPVTKSVKGISLRSALDLILDDFDLTYTIRDEVLQITSRERADEIQYTQVYRVDDIVTQRDRRRNIQELIDLITSTVQTDTWEESGGPGAINSFRDLLVVDQRLDVHEQIQDLLAKLRLALPKEPEAEAQDRAAAAAPPEGEPSPDTERKIVIYELRHLNPDDARQALTSLIMPDSWQGQGGDGAAYGVTFMPSAIEAKEFQLQQPRKLLAVRQQADVHRRIRALLSRLDRGPVTISGAPGAMNVRSN